MPNWKITRESSCLFLSDRHTGIFVSACASYGNGGPAAAPGIWIYLQNGQQPPLVTALVADAATFELNSPRISAASPISLVFI